MHISVVIPCRNGGKTIGRQLDALLAQDLAHAEYEIVVADNGSTDSTAAVVASYHNRQVAVRLADAHARPGINFARNEGVKQSSGEFVLLCDSDDLVHGGWLNSYSEAFLAGATCVGGTAERVTSNGQGVAFQHDLLTDPLMPYPYPLGANCGFARKVFDVIGGFDESFAGGCDEIDFFWRAAQAGYPTTLVRSATISYYERDSMSALARQYAAYGREYVKLSLKHGVEQSFANRLRTSGPQIAKSAMKIPFLRAGSRSRRSQVQNLAWNFGALRATAVGHYTPGGQ